MNPRIATLSLLLAGIPISSATAKTITVCADGCHHTSINAAIDSASDGDVIQLFAERYLEGDPIDPLGKAITLRGTAGPSGRPTTIIDGLDQHDLVHCHRHETRETILESLEFRAGSVFINGEAASEDGSSARPTNPTIRDCWFTEHHEDHALFALHSPVMVERCVFTENSYEYGCLIDIGASRFNPGPPGGTYRNCVFRGNTGHLVMTLGERVLMTGATIAENQVFHIINHRSYARGTRLVNSVIENHEAIDVIQGHGEEITIEDCMFRNNFHENGTRVIINTIGTMEIRGCHFEEDSGRGTLLHNSGQDTSMSAADCTFDRCREDVSDLHSKPYIDLGGNIFPVECDSVCPADFNGDGLVDGGDFARVLAQWGACDDDCPGDLDGNGSVDSSDLGLMLAHWGPCGP